MPALVRRDHLETGADPEADQREERIHEPDPVEVLFRARPEQILHLGLNPPPLADHLVPALPRGGDDLLRRGEPALWRRLQRAHEPPPQETGLNGVPPAPALPPALLQRR